MKMAVENLAKLEAAVGERFEIIELPRSDCPLYFCMAIPVGGAEPGPSWLPAAARLGQNRGASGAGLSREEARMRCLGEAVELVSSCWWGDEPTVFASLDELGDQAIPVDKLFGFSDTQYTTRDEWNAKYGRLAWVPPRLDRKEKIHWVEVKSLLGGESRFVPADYNFVGGGPQCGSEPVYLGDSNGCAAAATLDEAIVRGFLELVERDATAMWWYGRQQRPGIPLEAAIDCTELFEWLTHRPRSCHLLDITSSLEIPVIVAVSADPDGGAVALGYGASFDPHEAGLSAITEMCRMELSIEFAKLAPLEEQEPAMWQWLEHVHVNELEYLRPLEGFERTTVVVQKQGANGLSLLSCSREICTNCNFDCYFVNLTRIDFPISSARSMAPSLCHYKPRLACSRLAEASTKQSLCRGIAVKNELNDLFLFF
jgi:ribosomal protein S12 methylthiotransferase accessory factor